MTPLEKAGALAGLALPVLAAAWWAGAGYVEFNDRLAALEDGAADAQAFRLRYEREQTKDALVNDRVEKLAQHVDWLRHHHHDRHGGGPHTD